MTYHPQFQVGGNQPHRYHPLRLESALAGTLYEQPTQGISHPKMHMSGPVYPPFLHSPIVPTGHATWPVFHFIPPPHLYHPHIDSSVVLPPSSKMGIPFFQEPSTPTSPIIPPEKEIVVPPISPTKSISWKLHSMLRVDSSTKPLHSWDLRWPFDESVCSMLHSNPAHPFNRPATEPPAFNIRLLHKSLPWYINVTASTNQGITVFDLLNSLHNSLQTPVTPAEWRIQADQGEREGILEARKRRCSFYLHGLPEDKNQILRIDFLKNDICLNGLIFDEELVGKMVGKHKKYPRVLNLVMILGPLTS